MVYNKKPQGRSERCLKSHFDQGALQLHSIPCPLTDAEDFAHALHRIVGRLSSSKFLEVSYRPHRSHLILMTKATQGTTWTTETLSREEVSYVLMDNDYVVLLTINRCGLRGGAFGRMCLREICPRWSRIAPARFDVCDTLNSCSFKFGHQLRNHKHHRVKRESNDE